MATILGKNVMGERGDSRIAPELWSAMSHFVHCSRFAILFTASITASPAFAQDKSGDLATFLSGHLTATGQFQNYRDGSTRGMRVDIHGAPVGDAFKLVEDTVYFDGEKQHRVWRF
jgi:hypothetical protein